VLGLVGAAPGSVDVINMSFGSSAPLGAERDALASLESAGVTLVSSAGNSSGGAVGYPAAYTSVVAVSSTTPADALSSFSSVGPEVEIAAPGSNIYSTSKDGGYVHMSGTSMASPHVAGAAALVVAAGATDPAAVRDALARAEDIGLEPSQMGAGLLDVPGAFNLTVGDNLGNRAPIADAGPDLTVVAGQAVTLGGSATDPDGDGVSVAWSIESAPSGGEGSSFTAPTSATSDFTPDTPGDYVLSLTATEVGSAGLSASDTVTVTALDSNATIVSFTVDVTGTFRTAKGPWEDVTFVVRASTQNGPVEGAVLTADIIRETRTFSGLVETTNATGEASFTIRRALAEPYSIVVTGASHADPSLVWDGTQGTLELTETYP
jgi:subtilisin